uniref:Uncharacterized protein n=1 Tax=Rhizophagus irregularis (strain DAOM 181602 / DAOM 197198 / MUCL 43194) TaxID=747089 RepID=U9THS8_RHIID
MITDLVIDKGDKDKDYLEKHFADKSHDITFYDIPAYWSDEEILGLLNANVGVVEFINFKRCHKYKTVRTMLRFSKAYEKIYTEGGVNVSLTRNNDRTYFIRMFDSHLPYKMVKAFHAFFGKIIRVKGKRFIILYFNKQSDLMSAINKSIETSDIGRGLWIKKENDYIDDNGELQEDIPHHQEGIINGSHEGSFIIQTNLTNKNIENSKNILKDLNTAKIAKNYKEKTTHQYTWSISSLENLWLRLSAPWLDNPWLWYGGFIVEKL